MLAEGIGREVWRGAYPGAGSHVEVLVVHERSQGCHQIHKAPKSRDNAVEDCCWKSVVFDDP